MSDLTLFEMIYPCQTVTPHGVSDAKNTLKNTDALVIKSVSATGSISTIHHSEKRCFIRYINSLMSKKMQEGKVAEWSPISGELLESDELFNRLKDGVVFL